VNKAHPSLLIRNDDFVVHTMAAQKGKEIEAGIQAKKLNPNATISILCVVLKALSVSPLA